MLPHSLLGIRVRGCRWARVENWHKVHGSGKARKKRAPAPASLSMAMVMAQLAQVAQKVPFYRRIYPGRGK